MTLELSDSKPTNQIKEVSPLETWEQLKSDAKAQLIDVRTQPEWAFVGIPDLASLNKRALTLSWKTYPAFAVNENFTEQFAREITDKQTPVFFLCRSGGRSLDAARAMAAQGYTQCYNVTDGFEGEPDASHKRGLAAGWKACGLPWGQS